MREKAVMQTRCGEVVLNDLAKSVGTTNYFFLSFLQWF